MGDDTIDLSQASTPAVTTTAIVVKNAKGDGTSIRLKDSSGKFVRKNKPMPVSSQEIKRIGRKAMMKVKEGAKKTEIQAMVETAIKWANYDPGVDEKGNPVAPDPKMVAASKQWADWLMLHFVGKPGLTEEDKEDNKISGIKFVVFERPELMNKEVVNYEDRQKQPDKPAFAEVLSVETNDQ
jgi:hypothetical protein